MITDKPEKVIHDWYTSNITAITSANLTLRCESFYSSRTLNNEYHWNTVCYTFYLLIGWNAILIDTICFQNGITNNTFYLNDIVFDSAGLYYCDSSNLYFTFRSNYILNVIGMNTFYNWSV